MTEDLCCRETGGGECTTPPQPLPMISLQPGCFKQLNGGRYKQECGCLYLRLWANYVTHKLQNRLVWGNRKRSIGYIGGSAAAAALMWKFQENTAKLTTVIRTEFYYPVGFYCGLNLTTSNPLPLFTIHLVHYRRNIISCCRCIKIPSHEMDTKMYNVQNAVVSFLGACSKEDVRSKALILTAIFLWFSLIPVHPVLPLPLTFLSPSPHLSFILSVQLLFSACHLVHRLCAASFVFWPTANMNFHHIPVQNINRTWALHPHRFHWTPCACIFTPVLQGLP